MVICGHLSLFAAGGAVSSELFGAEGQRLTSAEQRTQGGLARISLVSALPRQSSALV